MKPLVIIGDSMLDVDVDGSADRLSPEAPVPVVEPQHIWHRPGGAGLAAVLAHRDYSNVVLVTGIGDDPTGHTLSRLIAEDHPGIRVVETPLRGGTVSKIRVRAGGQSVVRVDHGDGYTGEEALPDDVADVVREAAAICVADYGRGLAGHAQLREMLARTGAPVVWDPHVRGARPVPHCTLVVPNQDEAKHLSGSDHAGGQLAARLRTEWEAAAVSVTLGAGGAMFADRSHRAHHIRPADGVAAGHADTCGAGDRFSVAAAVALSEGADELQAATAAVAAASRFVTTGGATGVSSAMPIPGVKSADGAGAVIGVKPVRALADRTRRRGGSIVATGGCFDLLHTGHVRMLRRARDLGDALIVLINSDESVRAIKGQARPVVPAEDRARVLAALGCVDGVAIFPENSPATALEWLQPDIWVKGTDYSGRDLPEADVVRRHGGEVVLLATVPGYSSSKLIAAAR